MSHIQSGRPAHLNSAYHAELTLVDAIKNVEEGRNMLSGMQTAVQHASNENPCGRAMSSENGTRGLSAFASSSFVASYGARLMMRRRRS